MPEEQSNPNSLEAQQSLNAGHLVPAPAMLPQTTPINETAAIMGAITQAASDPKTDVVKLDKMMDLYIKMQDREAEKAAAADFCLLSLPKVKKTKYNGHTKSNYADLGDVLDAIKAPLKQCGFGVNFNVTQTEKDVTVTANLKHREGHIDTATVTMPIDGKGAQGTTNKTAVHGTASALSYAKRNALCSVLAISLGDMDDDGNGATTPELVTEEQAETIKVKLEQCSSEAKEKFMKYYGIIGNVPKDDLDGVLATMNRDIKKNGEANA